MLFGLAPSPFLLGGVIKQHLESWRHKNPETVREVNKSLYVDDLITGATITTKAKKMKDEATEVFADVTPPSSYTSGIQTSLHWNLTKSTYMLTSKTSPLPNSNLVSQKEENLDCSWNKRQDTISVTVPNETVPITKRGILTKVAKIYDLLGVASPLTLREKMLYRDACNLKQGWDQPLPADLAGRWNRWQI